MESRVQSSNASNNHIIHIIRYTYITHRWYVYMIQHSSRQQRQWPAYEARKAILGIRSHCLTQRRLDPIKHKRSLLCILAAQMNSLPFLLWMSWARSTYATFDDTSITPPIRPPDYSNCSPRRNLHSLIQSTFPRHSNLIVRRPHGILNASFVQYCCAGFSTLAIVIAVVASTTAI